MSDDRFPCFSVRQPWADLIVLGEKDVENKTKVAHFRGTILIHASAGKPDEDGMAWMQEIAHRGGILKEGETYEPARGAIIGMVDIVDCVTKKDCVSKKNRNRWCKSPWFEGPYGWCLANPVMFKREIPIKGYVGFFYVPRRLLKGTPAARKKAGQFVRV